MRKSVIKVNRLACFLVFMCIHFSDAPAVLALDPAVGTADAEIMDALLITRSSKVLDPLKPGVGYRA